MDANKKRCKHRILRKMIEFQKEIGTLGKEIDRKNTILLHFCCRGKVRKMIEKKVNDITTNGRKRNWNIK